MTEPPSLITVNFPWNLRMKPIASIRYVRLADGFLMHSVAPSRPRPFES